MATLVKPVELTEAQVEKIANAQIRFEVLINEAGQHFELDDKKLEEVCKNQVKQQHLYEVALQECKSIIDVLELHRDYVRSLLWQKYNENHKRTLTAKDIDIYISSEKEWLDIMEIILNINETRKKLEGIVEALKQLAWSLTNIVKLRVHQLEHATL
jgi:hypothetical protein